MLPAGKKWKNEVEDSLPSLCFWSTPLPFCPTGGSSWEIIAECEKT